MPICTCFVLTDKCSFCLRWRHSRTGCEHQPARSPPVFFVPPRDDLQRIVGQRPLQLERFPGRCIHPGVDFLPRRQNHGHRFRVDRPDLLVRFGRQKREDVDCCLAFLHFSNRGPARPDSGKEGQWPGLVEGEPNRRTGAIRQDLILGKTRPGHHAAVLDPEPAPPMRGFDIADIGDARIGFLALQRKDGRGHAPARHHKLTALGLIADNWGCVVGEDAIKRWQIARPVVHGTGEFADCPLAFRHRIEIAQKSVLLIATCRACGRRHRRAQLRAGAVHPVLAPLSAMPSVRKGKAAHWDPSERSVPAFGPQCRFCAGRMNDALHRLKAWHGPAKVRTLETFIPAEHFIFWTMSQFERGKDGTCDGNAQELFEFNPRLCLHGPRKTTCDCAKGRRKRTERKTQFFAKSQIGG